MMDNTGIVGQAEEVVREAGYDRDIPKRWTPRRFAQFLIKHAPQALDYPPSKILQKFPKMRTTEKMVAKMMNHDEFKAEINEIVALIKNRAELARKFYLYVQNLTDRTWKNPSVKVAELLGTISHEFVPTTKNISDPSKIAELSPEAAKEIALALKAAEKNQKDREGKHE